MPTQSIQQQEDDDEGIISAYVPAQNSDEEDGIISAYTATPEPDMAPMKQYFEANLSKAPAEGAAPREAKTFSEYIEAGWGSGLVGTVRNKGKPEVVMPPDASVVAQIVSTSAELVGDAPVSVPAAIGGFFAGGPLGSAAAGNAAPVAVRKILMDHYEKGDIKDADDFINRSMGTLWETAKAGAAGLAGGKAGQVVSKMAAPIAGSIVAKLAPPTAEVAAMATTSAALEGELPNPQDFTVATAMVGIVHTIGHVGGSKHVSGKLKKIYAETGIRPEDVVEHAKVDPVIQQDLLKAGDDIPSVYKEVAATDELGSGMKDVEVKPPVTMTDVMAEPAPEITREHPAVKEFLSQIKNQPEKAGAIENTINKLKDSRRRYIDQADPLKKWQDEVSGKTPVSFEDDFYKAKRMENEYKSKALVDFEDGHRDFKTGQVKQGEGLLKILQDAPDEAVLDTVLIANRDLDYQARGKNSGFNSQTAAEIRAMGGKKYNELGKRVVDWNHQSLKTLLDSEVIDQEAFDSMTKKGVFYIPLKHIADDDAAPVKRAGKGIKRVKGMKDGEQAIIESPTVAMYENNIAFRRMAEQNRAPLALLRFAEKNGIQLTEVKDKAVMSFVGADVINKHLEESGIKGKVGALKAWRSETPAVGPDEFSVIVKGERKVFKVPEGTGKEFAEAMSAYKGDFQSAGFAWGLAQGLTTAKKYAITSMPAFKIRNAWNDQFSLALNTKGGAIPFIDPMKNIYHILAKTNKYWDYKSSGGYQANFLKVDADYIRNKILEKHQKAGVFEQAWNVISEPSKLPARAKGFLDTTGNVLETATRMAEQQAVYKKTGNLFESGFAAREGTIDFEMRGSSQMLAQWNSVTAFMRPAIGGIEKTIREFKGVEGNRLEYTKRGIKYIAAPTIALYAYNYGNPRIENLSQFRKDMFWNIPLDDWGDVTPDDHIELLPEKEASYLTRVKDGKMQLNRGIIVSLPRAFIPGLIFGAAVDRTLDAAFKKDPRAFKGFAKAMRDQLMMPMIPDLPLPALEGASNYSYFRGYDLIPQHLEKAAPELRYTNYTTESAKRLSKLVPYVTAGMSDPGPAITENYIRSWAGPVGELALTLGDVALEASDVSDYERPEQGWFESPIIGSFIARSPTGGAEAINNFYDEASAVQQKKSILKDRDERGLEDGPQEEKDREEVGRKLGRINQIKKAMAVQRKMIRATLKDQEMPKHEKRQMVDGYTYMLINEARQGLADIDEVNKELSGN